MQPIRFGQVYRFNPQTITTGVDAAAYAMLKQSEGIEAAAGQGDKAGLVYTNENDNALALLKNPKANTARLAELERNAIPMTRHLTGTFGLDPLATNTLNVIA